MSLSRNVAIFLLIDLLCMTLVVFAGTAGSRQLLDDSDLNNAIDDAQKELNGLIESVWGGKCLTDDQCASFVAYCDKTQGASAALGLGLDGECRPSIWVWIILGAIVLLFLGSCICCICCGICSCILDCLCCCCRDKGYSPANTS